MERCEDRLMLSGDAFVGTIDLFGDSLTDATNGGFIYRLDQGGEIELDFVSDPLNGSQWYLLANGQVVEGPKLPTFDELVSSRSTIAVGAVDANGITVNTLGLQLDTNYTSTFDTSVLAAWSGLPAANGIPIVIQSPGFDLNHDELVITRGSANSSTFALDSGDAYSSGGLGQVADDYLRDDSLREFLPKPEITRFPLASPVMADQGGAAKGVISLAGLFDANQRTHDTELLAIRSALLASHLHQPTTTENSGVQVASPIVLQEAESESTWDRVWSFELASFSSKQAVADTSDASETPSVPKVVMPPLHHSALLPTGDSLVRVSIKREVALPIEALALNARSQDQAFAELDRVALSSNGWGLAADRRGGVLISVVAIIAAQRIWNAFPSLGSDEKEEPRRNNGTTKTS